MLRNYYQVTRVMIKTATLTIPSTFFNWVPYPLGSEMKGNLSNENVRSENIFNHQSEDPDIPSKLCQYSLTASGRLE